MSWATSRPEVSKIDSLKGLGCSGGVFIILKYGRLLKLLLFWRLISCSSLGLALGRQVWGVPVGSRAARAAGRGWQECHDPCGSTLLLPGPAGDHWEPLMLSSFAIYCLYSLSKSLSECLFNLLVEFTLSQNMAFTRKESLNYLTNSNQEATEIWQQRIISYEHDLKIHTQL